MSFEVKKTSFEQKIADARLAISNVKKSTTYRNLITKSRDDLSQKQLNKLRLNIKRHQIALDNAKSELAELEKTQAPPSKRRTVQKPVRYAQNSATHPKPTVTSRTVRAHVQRKARAVNLSAVKSNSISGHVASQEKAESNKPVIVKTMNIKSPRTLDDLDLDNLDFDTLLHTDNIQDDDIFGDFEETEPDLDDLDDL